MLGSIDMNPEYKIDKTEDYFSKDPSFVSKSVFVFMPSYFLALTTMFASSNLRQLLGF